MQESLSPMKQSFMLDPHTRILTAHETIFLLDPHVGILEAYETILYGGSLCKRSYHPRHN